ncbi:MAG: hypothetical protein KatS3mg105_0870 [Gemmatales bacterium]|nr:MAG: hypothetical protein KatS3mg105_0870 [Gemmatales bacterium]
MQAKTILPIAFFMALAQAAPAQNAMDWVFDESFATLATGNIGEFRKSADALVTDFYGGDILGEKPSAWLDEAVDYFYVSRGRNEKGSAAVIITEYLTFWSMLETMVLAIPYSDLDAMASEWGFKKGTFKTKHIYTVGGPPGRSIPFRFRYATETHLLISGTTKALKQVIKAKSIKNKLPRQLISRMGEAGLVIHVGYKNAPKDWQRNFIEGIQSLRLGETFRAATHDLEHLFLWKRYDEAVKLSFAPLFRSEGKAAQKLLTMLGAGAPAKSDFHGLPEGDLVAAHTSTANRHVAELLRVLLDDVLLDDYLPGADRENLLNIVTEISDKLHGARFGLYQSTAGSGLFSLVGILEADDADKFLADLRLLAKIGHYKGLDFDTDLARKANEKLIRQLIAELGASSYRVRESAFAKLLLIGEQALPYLKEAIKDADLERRRRAERLIGRIAEHLKERRETLLKPRWLMEIKPSFVFLDKREKIAGQDVMQIGIVFPRGEDATRAKFLSHYFGHDWKRIRLAKCGSKVVFMLGSDTKLFAEALDNVQKQKPGLARSPLARKIHSANGQTCVALSFAKILRLARMKDLVDEQAQKPLQDISSVQFTAKENYFILDLRVPKQEMRAAQALGQIRFLFLR